MRTYGYCRISRKTQSIERQIRNVKTAYPEAIIITEAFTGTRLEGRKEFERLCKAVKAGDTIVFDSVSRMSRNAEEGFQLYRELLQRGVELKFIKEPFVDTAVYREAASKQINAIQTGDKATDELMNAIVAGINKYMLALAEKQIQLAFQQSEKEVSDLHARTREGIETARLAGKQIGGITGKKLKIKKAEPAKKLIMKHSRDFNGTLSDGECMRLIGVARNTFYKYKRELQSV